MARYVSIRGWLETRFEDVSKIKNIVDNYTKNCDKYKIEKHIAILCNSGWHFPEKPLNWTSYVFYGADIRLIYLDYIEAQLLEILGSVSDEEEIDGIFYLDIEEEEEKPLVWIIKDKIIIKKPRCDSSI